MSDVPFVFSNKSSNGFRYGVPGEIEIVVQGENITYDSETGIPTDGIVTALGSDSPSSLYWGMTRLRDFDPITVSELIDISPG